MSKESSVVALITVAIAVISSIYYLKRSGKYNIGEAVSEHFYSDSSIASTASTVSIASIFEPVIGRNIIIKPNLYFVVDDYGTNNRRWVDFGARSSRDLNMGFLDITRTKCFYTQGGDFEIILLMGRDAVAKKIYEYRGVVPDNHKKVYPAIWKAWARSALLTHCGGMFFDGLSLCLGPRFLPVVKNYPVAVFGTAHDEPQTSSLNGSCSEFTGWSKQANHPAWANLNNDLLEIIDAGNTSWTSAIARNTLAVLYNKHLRDSMPTLRQCEWSRRHDGRPIEIEDMFGRSFSELNKEWSAPESAVYLPLDYETINRSFTYKWFLSLTAQEIMSPKSQFLWAVLSQNNRR
jgi:hypothetical protein